MFKFRIVSQDEWADVCSDYRTRASEPDSRTLNIIAIETDEIIGRVRYAPDAANVYEVASTIRAKKIDYAALSVALFGARHGSN